MSQSQTHPGLAEELSRYWHGDGPLWKLYWIYGVGISTLGGAAILTAVIERAVTWPVLVPILALAMLYTAFIQISVWRSAFNIGSDPLGIDREAWGWIARVLTVGWALNAAGGSLMLLQVAMGY